jgi:hypothetical protein
MEPYKDYVFSNENSKKLSAMGINFPTGQALTDKLKKRIKSVFQEFA